MGHRLQGISSRRSPCGSSRRCRLTVGMPDFAHETHLWRRQRIVLRELELCVEHAAFKRRALGPLNQRFPQKHVIFGDGPCGDALGRVCHKPPVLFEQPFAGRGGHQECAGVEGGGRQDTVSGDGYRDRGRKQCRNTTLKSALAVSSDRTKNAGIRTGTRCLAIGT